MKAIAVDDEVLMLRALVKAVSASEDIDSVAAFSSCDEVLEWMGKHPADLAFLDINKGSEDLHWQNASRRCSHNAGSSSAQGMNSMLWKRSACTLPVIL